MCAWNRYGDRNTGDDRRDRTYYHEDRSYVGYDSGDQYGYRYRDSRFREYDRREYSPVIRDYDDRHDSREWSYRQYRESQRRGDEYYGGYSRNAERYDDRYDHMSYPHGDKTAGRYLTRVIERERGETDRSPGPTANNSSGSHNDFGTSGDAISRNVDSNRGGYVGAREQIVDEYGDVRSHRTIDTDDRNATSSSGTRTESAVKVEWYMHPRYQGSRRSGSDPKEDNKSYTRPRRNHADSTAERENSATVLVRNLLPTISAEDVENAVSDLCIQNGTSAPNTVNIRSYQTGYGGVSQHSLGIADGYNFDATAERFAVVTFPSPGNAARFMECVKSRKLEVNGLEFYVEYDTLEVNAGKSANDKIMNYDDMLEFETLMKRRIFSCDWICPSCRFINFARRTTCLSCEKVKPSEEQLQSQNLLVDAASAGQTKLIHTNVTDVSSWVVLKGIPLAADPSKLVILVCSNVPEGAAHLQRCVYVIDPQPKSRRGFMFCQFSSVVPVTGFQEALGDKLSELIHFHDGYLRLEAVRSLEKQVADELLKGVRMNTLKVHYEFHQETFVATALADEPTAKLVGNKECRTVKVKTTNVGALEQLCNTHNAPPGSRKYVNSWLCKEIALPDGKPDTAKLTYDPTSDYFYDYRLGVYFDAASGYYMSLNKDYYVWDEPSSALVIVEQQGSHDPADQGNAQQNPSNVAGLLESALKAAQMTNQSTQKATNRAAEKLSSDNLGKPQCSDIVKEGGSGSHIVTSASPVGPLAPSQLPDEIFRTFDLSIQSDDECEMEVDCADKPSTIIDTSGVVTASKKVLKVEVRPLVVCLVCLRMFTDQSKLELHERRSRYHQIMLECDRSIT
ncbi:uncharacterized protein BXIN_1421 [Babesia sp. Xinjiang]|uniref:uncharacterized protein n=1 Tax=Babesia sp. Xinjiang TaxID=462227 RepID=UPI000A250379|nr:uncharacterized protein BXIN_1421 [Babesia sp. Xinjiang]ORM39953.1 hypothetical protein BXIN_1421 [Babesia sp. Xinjiang]